MVKKTLELIKLGCGYGLPGMGRLTMDEAGLDGVKGRAVLAEIKQKLRYLWGRVFYIEGFRPEHKKECAKGERRWLRN